MINGIIFDEIIRFSWKNMNMDMLKRKENIFFEIKIIAMKSNTLTVCPAYSPSCIAILKDFAP